MVPIQLTKDQETELLSMTRAVTPADETALNRAYVELESKGFIMNGENFMVLYRAYNQSPQVPITTQGVLDYTTKFRDAFQWLSATELAYNQIKAQIGPDKTAEVTKLLKSHSLYAPPDEHGIDNFVALVRHSQNQGWGLDRDTFLRLISHLQRYVPNTQLYWAPTPKQDWQKERDRQAEQAQKAAEAYREYHRKLSPEYQEEQRLKREAEEIQHSNDSYWQQRVNSYIASIQSHVLRAEAEELFGKQAMNANWQVNFVSLENWLSKKKNQPGHWY